MAKHITLPEHNSSRLLFIDNQTLNDTELLIRDTTTDTNCDCDDDYNWSNCWLLGKLNSKVFIIEDCGIYDSNHTHSAEIYYIDPSTNQEVILYNVDRAMEYRSECDRCYLQHSGGLKVQLLQPTIETITSNFYIKYEQNLPGVKEVYSTESINNETNHYVSFYKYNENNELGIYEIAGISNKLIVNTDEQDQNGNLIQMSGLNYAAIDIQNVIPEFGKISVNYKMHINMENDIAIGILGINTTNHKFLSYHLSDCIEPSYFIVETPNNRSWICYRTCYDRLGYIAYNGRKINNNFCGYLNAPGEGLNGYYGFDTGNHYTYTINIDRSKLPFTLAIPKMFCDYSQILFRDSSNNLINFGAYTDYAEIYNELDGMSYEIYMINNNVQTAKIILVYDKQ